MVLDRTVGSLVWSTKGEVTRQERFLAEMDQDPRPAIQSGSHTDQQRIES